ncbi:MAG: hypothetical protein KDC24_08680 [Saprospiraceae bacterium]|nr:hypothetical protein [Saprospiraceae bacterium]
MKTHYPPTFLLFLFFFTSIQLHGQKVVNALSYEEGTITYADGISLPKTPFGYTLILPDSADPKGLLVFFHAQSPEAPLDSIAQFAIDKNMGVLYLATNNRLEFFFEKEKMAEVASYLKTVVGDYPATRLNLLFAGMSLEGTRALKLTHFLKEHPKYKVHPKAIVICDAPLDMIRFYKEAKRAGELNFQEAAANEGRWVSAYLENNLGTPDKNRAAYRSYSPYCYDQPENEYLNYLDDVYIRAYTEPDVDWWMETRRKSYYGMNALDLAALINELNIRGNENARLVNTQNKGYRPDGSRHPHSWSIVDDKEVVEWFTGMVE